MCIPLPISFFSTKYYFILKFSLFFLFKILFLQILTIFWTIYFIFILIILILNLLLIFLLQHFNFSFFFAFIFQNKNYFVHIFWPFFPHFWPFPWVQKWQNFDSDIFIFVLFVFRIKFYVKINFNFEHWQKIYIIIFLIKVKYFPLFCPFFTHFWPFLTIFDHFHGFKKGKILIVTFSFLF